MFKFMRGRAGGAGHHLSADRIKDLFSLSKATRHGFPHNPTALAHDPSLDLIAIATRKSEIRVYGRPGVEYTGELDPESVVKEMHFIPDKRGQLVLLMDDGVIQLWQLATEASSDGQFRVEKVKSVEDFRRGHEQDVRVAVTLMVTESKEEILVGTTGGNIHSISLSSFSLTEGPDAVLYQEAVLHSASPNNKITTQGSVEVLAQRPGHADSFLIGYQRGVLVLWNASTRSAERVYHSGQQVESASWLSSGQGFTSCHNDGRYISWKVSDSPNPVADNSRIPYGPFPCKPIGRIFQKTVRNAENLLVFTGGMPRSTYGDKMTVSLIQGDQDSGKHQVLDFTSKVIDLLVLDDPQDDEFDNPIAVLILLEEELVVIDVRHPEWLPIKLPLLSSVHSSGITSCVHYSDLADEVYADILSAGKQQDAGRYSTADWPITGGSLPPEPVSADEDKSQDAPAVTQDADQPQDVIPGLTEESKSPEDEGKKDEDDEKKTPSDEKKEADAGDKDQEATTVSPVIASSPATKTKTKDVLITGHEDGSILLWDATDVNLRHILTINTRKYFHATDGDIAPIDGDEGTTASPDAEEADGSEWPPFRKVGTFDPYSDDTRLAIRRLALCPMTGAFAAAGTAGQVLYFKLTTESSGDAKPLPVHSANLVQETTGFAWKGHDQLHVRTTAIKLEPGFEAEFVIQLSPPAAVTALSLHSEWHLLSAGTAHGFVVYDLLAGKILLNKCTLNPADLAATAGGDVLISRRKSFKKSLRESFRRLRRGRSTRVKKPATAESSPEKSSDTPATSPIRSIASAAAADDGDTGKPVERQIEARQDDGLGSMIRTISFTTANILSPGSSVPSLWVGTNAGAVLIYTVTLAEDEEKRTDGSEQVTLTIAKEIQLKHRAPVIFVQVIDSTGYPLPGPHEVVSGKAKAPSTVGHQRVLIVSEEQFKLFTLPNLKPDRKSKLTAHEGSRARRITIAQFAAGQQATPDSQQPLKSPVEHCLTCCSNQGDVSVYSIPDLKRLQNHVSVIKREDVHGIASVVLTTRGEGLFLHSPSEFQRFSLSAHRVVKANGFVTIPEGARPVLVEPPTPEPVVEEAKAEEEAEARPASSTPDPVLGSAIKEETEEEIAAAVAAVTATSAATSVLEPVVMDPPPPTPASASSFLPEPKKSESTTHAVSAKTAPPATDSLIDSALNGSDVVMQDLTSAAVDHVVDVIESEVSNNSLIPDLVSHSMSGAVNGLNGHKKNGHHVGVEDEEDSSSEAQVNGGSGANGTLTPDMSATSSILNAGDITIDSVRDFTNLTLSEEKKPIVKSVPTSDVEADHGTEGASAAVAEVGGEGEGVADDSTSEPATRGKGGNKQNTSSSNIPRSNSSRGGGGGRRNKNNAHNKQNSSRQQQQRNPQRNNQHQTQQQQHDDE